MFRQTENSTNSFNLIEIQVLFNKYITQLKTLLSNDSSIPRIKNSMQELSEYFNNLYIYLEGFDIISNYSSLQLYKFQNQLYNININDILREIWISSSNNEEIFFLKKDLGNLFENIKEHICSLIADILIERKEDEFLLFQQMEMSNIDTIKKHLIANGNCHSTDFSNDLHHISNANARSEFNRKRLVFLWAALLKENVNFEKIFLMGLNQMPESVSYNTDRIISNEEKEIRENEEKERIQLTKHLMQYLHYCPLIAYGKASYENLPAKVASLEANPQYCRVAKRIQLMSVMGNMLYGTEQYKALRTKHGGDLLPRLRDTTDAIEITWLTKWRQKELDNLKDEVKNNPHLVEKIALIEKNPITVKWLGAAIVVHMGDEIQEILFELHLNDLKKFSEFNLKNTNLTLFSTTTAAHQSSVDGAFTAPAATLKNN